MMIYRPLKIILYFLRKVNVINYNNITEFIKNKFLIEYNLIK